MKKITTSFLPICSLITIFFSSLTYSQEFSNINNIERLFTLSPKQIDSTLVKDGYILKEKNLKTNIFTYEKSIPQNGYNFNVNVYYEKNLLQKFCWDDYLQRASFIVSDMNENYKIDESKTNDGLGIFYLTCNFSDLDAIIFKTFENTQKGKIAFTIFKREKSKQLKKK